jgi:prefoldin beta subunit
MSNEKQAQENINKLQILEQKMHSILMQKQNFQSRLLETENALHELEGVDKAYKVVGNIMVNYSAKDLTSELGKQKLSFEEGLKSVEEQEKKLKKSSEEIQKELAEQIK